MSANPIIRRADELPIRLTIARPISGFEYAFTVSVLLVGIIGVGNLSLDNMIDGSNASSRILQVLWGSASLTSTFLVLSRCRSALRALKSDYALLLMLAIIAVSTVWSFSPALTFRRSVALIGTTLIGAYFGRRFSTEQQLRLLAIAGLIVSVMSYVFEIAGIGYSVNGNGGWIGVFPQKNLLARQMILNILVLCFLVRSKSGGWKLVSLFGVALCAPLLVLSKSATGIVVACMLPLFFAFARGWRSRYRYLMVNVLIGCAALVPTVVIPLTYRILESVGRGVTLTGRIPLWIATFYVAKERSLLGFGYSTFWIPEIGPCIPVQRAVHWAAPHGHNGYLDIWVDLGIVGLVAFFIWLASAFRASLAAARSSRVAFTSWPLMFMFVLLTYNLTESCMFFQRNSLWWVVTVAAIVSARRYVDFSAVRIKFRGKETMLYPEWRFRVKTRPLLERT